MKQLLMVSAIFLAFQAQAETFKCKNDNGKITYQGTPCLTATVGKIKKAPDVPVEEQVRAQDRLNNTIEMNRQKEAAEEVERQQQEENAKRIAQQKELERQQREESYRKFLLEQEAKAQEKRKEDLLLRQTQAAERAAAAAERAGAQKRSFDCRPNYAGGLVCD